MKAREDADRTAKPLTEIVEVHEDKGQCLFPGRGQRYVVRDTAEAKPWDRCTHFLYEDQRAKCGCWDWPEDRPAEATACPECNGMGCAGTKPVVRCSACSGSGLRPNEATVKAFIKDHAPEPARDTNEAQPSRLLSPTKTSAEARRIVRQGMNKYAIDYLNEEPEDETGADQLKILTSLLESVWDEGWEFCAAGRESVRDTVEGPPQERVTGEPGRCPAVHPGDGGRCIYGAGHSIEYHCDGGAKWDSSASSPTPDYDVLRLRLVRLESAAGFVVRRIELATSESLRDRIETSPVMSPAEHELRRLVEFIRADQCDVECQCCKDYLNMANVAAHGAGLPDGYTCYRCDGDGHMGGSPLPCRGCKGTGRLATPQAKKEGE